MTIKVVQSSGTQLHDCTSIAVTPTRDADGRYTRVVVLIKPSGDMLSIDQPGDAIYVMNGESQTVDCYRIPAA